METFEVYFWTRNEDGYYWEMFWSGTDLIDALSKLKRAKEKEKGCVKLEWR